MRTQRYRLVLLFCFEDSPFVSLINEGGHSRYFLDRCLLSPQSRRAMIPVAFNNLYLEMTTVLLMLSKDGCRYQSLLEEEEVTCSITNI